MASIERTRYVTMVGTGGFFGAIGVALRGLAGQRVGAVTHSLVQMPAVTSELFARAIADDSNSAMDWLYYAGQLHDEERLHCLAQAEALAHGDPVVIGEIRRLTRG